MKVWTEPLNPVEIEDVFLIPGGKGVKSFLHTEGDKGQLLLKQAVQEAGFCMMVQNASAMLARTGLLFHRQVADYDYDENWKRMFTVGINHVTDGNWISDGKYYSSSTTTAAMDMALGLISDMLDIDIAEKIAEEKATKETIERIVQYKKVGKIGLVIVGVTATCYGVYRSAPKVKRWWNSRKEIVNTESNQE